AANAGDWERQSPVRAVSISAAGRAPGPVMATDSRWCPPVRLTRRTVGVCGHDGAMTTSDQAAAHPDSTTDAADPLRVRAEELLRGLAGPEARLRPDQWTAIAALVRDRRRALVVQRTGWGKSAVYFIAAMLLREAGHGATVIVSPLLALMRNQVAAAERAGVRAATINSGNVTEWESIHAAVAAGEVDVLLVSPERLNNPDFRDQV